jgi:DNA-binding NtrC family response regulator
VTFSDAALRLLQAYDFPGNVRELRNLVERALLLADEDLVQPQHLPAQVSGLQPSKADTPSEALLTLAAAEANYLRRALALHQGDRKSLAAKLGVSERVLYRKLAELKPGASAKS